MKYSPVATISAPVKTCRVEGKRKLPLGEPLSAKAQRNAYASKWLKTPAGREYLKRKAAVRRSLTVPGLKAFGASAWRDGNARKLGVFANEVGFHKHNSKWRHL